MTSRSKRLLIAAIVPFVALWVAAWFDGNVVNDAATQAGHNYDFTPAYLATSISYLVAMAGGLAVAATAWWIRERIVGLVYLVIGAFVLFDGFLVVKFATIGNGTTATAAPEPIARFLTQVMLSTTGRSNAALVVAAAMLLAGLGSLVLAGRDRPEPAAS